MSDCKGEDDYNLEGGPAFAHGSREHGGHPGMTLRDWFAGQALSNPAICRYDDEFPHKAAYAFADAMIAERKKG